MTVLKKLLFFWVTSFSIAISCYYLLWLIMPKHYVFGVWYRMFLYHYQHPVQYIFIPCFFYGFIATFYTTKFYLQTTKKQVLTTSLIIILTVILSSPFGGMLWVYHDMQAGYFPVNWFKKILTDGVSTGLSIGWLIILLSIPYNVLGFIVCYFLTKKGSELFKKIN